MITEPDHAFTPRPHRPGHARRDPCHGGLTFCNQTAAYVTVAVGFDDNDTWVSEGWWGMDPGDCVTVLSGDLTHRYYYYRATSRDMDFPGEEYFFCTDSGPFEIRGDTDCVDRGFRRQEFASVDTGTAAAYTVELTSDDNPAPGVYGEPYSVSGVLSHCDVTDTTLQCELHAYGYRYVASSADPTPMATLEALLDLPENTPMAWAGDLMAENGVTAEVTIREIDDTVTDPYADLRAALQGLWRSTDDSAYELLIHGGLFEELYDGTPTGTAVMELAQTCDGALGDGPYVDLHSLNGPDYDQCHAVVSVTGDTLTLFPVGTMGDLNFHKVN